MDDEPSESDEFDGWIVSVRNRARQIYESLKRGGVRIFAVSLGRNELKAGHPQYWALDTKTVDEWRRDIREFIAVSEASDEDLSRGRADNDVYNALAGHLESLGYADVSDVVADVFEGRITNERARLIHDPVHEEQPDGFGHHGWENGRGPEKK